MIEALEVWLRSGPSCSQMIIHLQLKDVTLIFHRRSTLLYSLASKHSRKSPLMWFSEI